MEQSYELRQFSALEPSRQDRQCHVPTTDGDFEGFDNEGFDVSQFERYLCNETTTDTMYFGDIVADDLKPNVNGNATPARASPSSAPQTLYHLHQMTTPHYHQGHGIPDSPPDSASEPPYSPADNPNLSPNQRNQALEASSPSHSAHSILHIGGYGGLHPPSHQHHQQPSGPHHSLTNPHLTNSSLQVQPAPSAVSTHYPPHGSFIQPVCPTQGPGPGVPLSYSASPTSLYAGHGVTSAGHRGDTTSCSSGSDVTAKKRRASEAGLPTNVHARSISIKQEPGQSSSGSLMATGTASSVGVHSSSHSSLPTMLSPQVSDPGTKLAPSLHPGGVSYPLDEEEFAIETSTSGFAEPPYQCIQFQQFQQQSWGTVYDSSNNKLTLNFRVDADKGFNFSHPDDAYVCQKKNHFQVTTQFQFSEGAEPCFVKTQEGTLKIDSLYLNFYGVKTESPSQTIRVEQSQSDRSKKAFHPIQLELKANLSRKITVGRLHFSETTSNNMRKKGKPNPDQRYFYLVVSLQAHCQDNVVALMSYASDKIIVRASNPGQFESDVEYTFQRGSYPDSIYHMGKVGINTDRPDEALVVHGNAKVTGQLLHPSDVRAKERIQELDTREQLKNVQNLRVVKYLYRMPYAQRNGVTSKDYDTGVIAQEVKQVIPEAVKDAGEIRLVNGERITNFLYVNKDRIYMENVGAVKELCKVTGNLENRIGKLERISSKTSKVERFDSFKSNSSCSTRTSVTSHMSSVSYHHHRRRVQPNRKNEQSDFCTNKMLHLSTISVMVVMLICLIVMVTIYVLEYKDSKGKQFASSSSFQNYTVIPSSSPTTSIPLDLTMSILPFTTEIHASQTASVSPHSSPRYQTITATPYTRSTTTSATTDISTYLLNFSTTVVPLFSGRPRLRPPPLGAPSECQDRRSLSYRECQVYCCPSIAPMPSMISPREYTTGSVQPSFAVTRRYRNNGNSSPSMAYQDDVQNNKLSTIDPYNFSSTEVTYPKFKSMPSKKSGTQYFRFVRMSESPEKTPTSRKIKQTLSKREALPGTNEEASENPLLPIAIRIPEFEERQGFIPKLYLVNGTQEPNWNSTSDDYTYNLPLSKYMSYANLTLEFEFFNESMADQFAFCSSCSECLASAESDAQCEASSTPESQRVDGSILRSLATREGAFYRTPLVGVGHWKFSQYSFRLKLHTGDRRDVCSYPSDQIGNHFITFNFFLNRVCEG